MEAYYKMLTGFAALDRILEIEAGTYELNPVCKSGDSFLAVSFAEYFTRE